MSFHQQSFAARHGAMGDQAERIFDTLHGDRVHRLGLNRVWENGKRLTLNQMTVPMRYAPDRMIGDRLVEVMGVGRDQTLKIKLEKMIALHAWQAIGPVNLFVYDSYNKRWFEADLAEWFRSCQKHGKIELFSEGKQYWGLHSKFFPCEPTTVEVDDGT